MTRWSDLRPGDVGVCRVTSGALFLVLAERPRLFLNLLSGGTYVGRDDSNRIEPTSWIVLRAGARADEPTE